MEKLPEINILAFGDSLTEGYYRYEMFPYTNELNKLFQNQQKYHVKIVNQGESGELVTRTMLERIQDEFKKNKYDITIILGGTNDLGYRIPPQNISETLKKMHQICWDHNSLTISLTVPQCRVNMQCDRRNELNKSIQEFSQNEYNSKAYFLDFYNQMPFNDQNGLWAQDGLHMSPDGYKHMGNLIFNYIIENQITEKINSQQ